MSARQAVPIAPAGDIPGPLFSDCTHPVLGLPTSTPGLHEGDIVVTDGAAFNGRGYRVCGVVNQRGSLCGRIGVCPFHSRSKDSDIGEEKEVVGENEGNTSVAVFEVHPESASGEAQIPDSVIRMNVAPTKSRFKRSWSKEEHSLFLVALKKHGRGKWKEIAKELTTRTANQCQSHAQKYFLRQRKDKSARRKHSIHDITEPDAASVSMKESAERGSIVARADAFASSATGTLPGHNNARELGRPGTDSIYNLSAPIRDVAPNVLRLNGSLQLMTRNVDPVLREEAELLLPGPPNHRDSVGAPIATIHRDVQSRPDMRDAHMHGVAVACPDPSASPSASPGTTATPLIFPLQAVCNISASREKDWSKFVFPRQVLRSSSIVIPATQMNVFIHVNGTASKGQPIALPESMCRNEFLETAAAELGLPSRVSRIFVRSGTEIQSLDELCHDEHLWLSTGDEFLYPED